MFGLHTEGSIAHNCLFILQMSAYLNCRNELLDTQNEMFSLRSKRKLLVCRLTAELLNEMFQKYYEYAGKHVSCFLSNQIVHSSWISFAIKARHWVCQHTMGSRLQLAGGAGLGVSRLLVLLLSCFLSAMPLIPWWDLRQVLLPHACLSSPGTAPAYQ